MNWNGRLAGQYCSTRFTIHFSFAPRLCYSETMKYRERAREVIETEAESLQRLTDNLDEGFDAAIKILLECLEHKGRIAVTGVGKNFHVAQKISATLSSTGSPSVVLNATQAMHGDMGVLCEGDVLLALSYTGETDELVALVPVVKRMGVKIIAMTGMPSSSLARHSDAIVRVTVPREACPFNMAPTCSTTATMAMGDAMAMVLLQERGFMKEDYAKLHPGGAIGRALLLRIRDIMRTGERLAMVTKGGKVKDAVLAMSNARCGSVAVTDKKKKLLGILTDGDLRRHLASDSKLLDRPVEDIMTPSPVSIGPDKLAADALHVFELKNIDDILVVDDTGCVIGAVDIQDLPKFKIM